jgi:hypothetical protein
MTVLCKCGCGDPAPVIVKNNTARGYVAGEHHEYIRNHRKRKRTYVHFKFCNDCRQLKHKNAFTDCISSRDGKQTYCKSCTRGKYQLDPAKVRSYSKARRARLLGVFVEHVDAQVLFERDEGVCGICNTAVNRDDMHIDHIVPLSRGGLHCYANVQVAHSRCNLRKRNKIELDTVRS